MKIGNFLYCCYIFILSEIFDKSLGETPLSTCPINKPFKVQDGCANFVDICIKSDDAECKRFLTACEQCPPSNLTNFLLLYIQAELNSQKSHSQVLFYKLEKKVDLTRAKLDSKTEVITILLIIIIVINIILVFVLLIEIRFKLITKCLDSKHRKKNRKDYQKVNNSNANTEMGNITVNEISKVFDQKLNGAMEKLKADLVNPPAQFKIDGDDKIIELPISADDCIVKIKRLICEQIPSDRSYKIMELKFMNRILDVNQYLLSHIGSRRATIFCQFNNNIDPNDDVILQLSGNLKLPEFIQVNKNLSILQLKNIISKFIFSTNFVILKDGKPSKKLDENLTVFGNNLHDQDLIKIIISESRNFVIKSIFNEKDSIGVSCDIMNPVSTLSGLAAERFSSEPENFILFLHNQYLSSDRCIYEFEEQCENEIKFCCLMKMKYVIPSTSIFVGDNSDIYIVDDTTLNTKVIVKRYQLPKKNLLNERSPFINELITVQITKKNNTFVKLLNVYKNESHFFISLEYLENGSITEFISKNGLQSEDVIAKWSKKILEGLKYLHDHNIIHRDLKPSNILLDKNHNIKLSGFDLSKYISEQNDMLKGFANSRVGTYRYMAPEIHKGEKYGYLVDVWSFGITLIEIVTNSKIYPDLNECDFIAKMGEVENINWEPLQENSKILIEFINMCLIYDPQKRTTVEKLLNHQFLKKK